MYRRGILSLGGLLALVATAPAQPWPNKDAKSDAALDILLNAALASGAVGKAPASEPSDVRWEVIDASRLGRELAAARSMMTEGLGDAIVLRWRDDAANRPFWTASMRAIANARDRPRERGFADLLEAVAASGDGKSIGQADKLLASAKQHFQLAQDTAWIGAVEIEIGNAALAKDRFAEADAAYVRAGQLYAAARGARTPLVASAVQNRGNVAYQLQKYSDAIRHHREALEMLGADDGPNALAIAGCLQNLANAHMGNKDAPAARGALDRGLAIIRKAEGGQSARQLPFLEALGQIYLSRHETSSARDVAIQALEFARKAFGDQSASTVRYMSTLAMHERSVGNAAAAQQLLRDALRILEGQTPRVEYEIANIRSSLGEVYETLAKPDQATGEYQLALQGYRNGPTRRDRIGEIFTLRSLGRLASKLGKNAESKSKFRAAIDVAAKTLGPTHPFLGSLRQDLGLELLEEGAFAEAIAEFRSARAPIDRTARPIDWAEATANLAMALEMAGDLTEAQRELAAAIEIYRREQHPKLASAYATLASIHRKRDDYEESARVHRLALEIQKTALGPEDPMTLHLRYMIALDQQFAGHHAEAEKSFQELADIKKKTVGPDHPEFVNLLTQIAAARAEGGQLAEAIGTYEEAIKIQRASNRFPWRQRIDTLMGLSKLFELKRDWNRAIETLDEARKLFIESGSTETQSYAFLLHARGAVSEKAGDTKSAEQLFSTVMEIYRKLKAIGQPGAMLTIKRLATLRNDAGDIAGALKWIDEGLAALAVDPPADGLPWRLSPHSVDLLTLKAETLQRSDRSVAMHKTAFRLLATAGEITDRLRVLERTSEVAKANLVDAVQSESMLLRLTICERLAHAEPNGGWTIAAFRSAEENRARVFLELLGRSRSEIVGDLAAELAARERKCAQALAGLQRALESAESAPFDRREPDRIASLQKALADEIRTSEEIQSLIARDHPRVAALRRPYPCSVNEARAALAKNEAAVIYCCGGKVSYAIVLKSPESVDQQVTLLPLPGMDEFADDLELLISENNLKVADLYRDKAAKLYRALVAPLEPILGDRNLLIVPDGKLGLLAFEALIDGRGRFLIESRAVRMAPSMTALHLNRLWDRKRVRPTRAVLAIGDPVTSPSDQRLGGQPLAPSIRRLSQRTGERFERLVHSGREAIAIADVFRAPVEDRWLGWDAAESRLKARDFAERLADYRYLHFAAHGILGSGREFPPALMLSAATTEGSNGDDGILNVSEVSRLRLNADLVVLSACRSASGEIRTGEGITGLARSFLGAGSRGVISSLWTVDDRDTVDTMVDFYRQLERNEPVATALRKIKLRMIQDGKHPFEWAPFVLIGDSN